MVQAYLSAGDIVFFRKTEGVLAGPWTLGEIDTVVRGRDNLVRRVKIRYVNPLEVSDQGQRSVERLTDRAVRSVVRLFNIEDTTWRQDLARVEALVKDLGVESLTNNSGVPADSLPCSHCCSAHCSLLGHPVRPVQIKVPRSATSLMLMGSESSMM